MRLTFYTDYALRLLIYLAVKDGGLATVGEVARAYGISQAHLVKVAHDLRNAGYIKTARGRGGGLTLAQVPAAIRVGDVVRRTEPDLALVPCFEPLCAPCPIVAACGLVHVMREARAAFLEVADRYTLEHLARRRADLAALLTPGSGDRDGPGAPARRAARRVRAPSETGPAGHGG